MSGWRQINNSGIFGTTRVGIPAEDIPVGSLLEEAALEYPDDLLRSYVTSKPDGVFIEEDGSFTYTGLSFTFYYDLYVNGVYVEQRQFLSGTFNLVGGIPFQCTTPIALFFRR